MLHQALFLQPCSASLLPSVISKKQTQMLVGGWLVWKQVLSLRNLTSTSSSLWCCYYSGPYHPVCVCVCGEGCVVGTKACRLASTHRCQECFSPSCENCPDTIQCPLKDRPPSENHCLRCPLLRDLGPGSMATSVPMLVAMGERGSLLGRWPKGTPGMRGASQRDKGASAGEGGAVVIREDKVYRKPEAEA